MKDKLRDVHLNSCLLCSKLDNSVLNTMELGGCCGVCIDCTLKGAPRKGLKFERRQSLRTTQWPGRSEKAIAYCYRSPISSSPSS